MTIINGTDDPRTLARAGVGGDDSLRGGAGADEFVGGPDAAAPHNPGMSG
ncbi:hypothetical protein [Inquilinus sp. CA228]